MKRLFTLLTLSSLFIHTASAQALSPDSTVQAMKRLQTLRESLHKSIPVIDNKAPFISTMLQLGMWDEALAWINKGDQRAREYKLLRADYFILQNQYAAAEMLVNEVLKASPNHTRAAGLKAFLQIQAWKLPQAAATCRNALVKKPGDEYLEVMLGRVLLLQKNYPQALALAKKLIAKNPLNANAYLLEADVYFWDQRPELAEAPLKKSLSINPLNADARFNYGYAIWRRVDATQLNAMAAQWEIALAVNPLHYQTHWHWGNGHTNLTYADYAQADDEQVRGELEEADALFRNNRVAEALEHTRRIGAKYPSSVLPLMHRASIFYSAFDTDWHARLDSAERIFKSVLAVKKHYGPAHNGLSAVLKSKRLRYLAMYDSVTAALQQPAITDMKNFTRVFPDVSYYPGQTAKAMVWNQLYSAVAYFPFLSRQDNAFRIPPLHHDLAITMNSPSFRYTTTFDNRQWMDIRGVGSGAAAIEYVERGAFLERNVILHEYVHLFHSRVMTDAESRKIRALYYQAMKEKRTLDYYSQNNESEYFAQTYPAYFEPVKVHPLDFKSMNTTSDLRRKDPGMYAFIDQLVKKERAYLAGDKQAMASNWAQVYVNLAGRTRRNPVETKKLLDTALTYDAKYLPAYLAFARLEQDQKSFAAAESWLKKAEAINGNYAPIYSALASLSGARLRNGDIDTDKSLEEQAAYLKKALKLEDDYQERAGISEDLRELYRTNGMMAEAIAVAEAYIKTAPVISTYLRDVKEDAVAYVASLKSSLGYPEQVGVLKKLVEQRPQNYDFRNQYADALANAGRYNEAIGTLKEAQRILQSAGNSRPGFALRMAECYFALGKKDSVQQYLPANFNDRFLPNDDRLRYVRLLIGMGKTENASQLFVTLPESGGKLYNADYVFTEGKFEEATGNIGAAIGKYEDTIRLNPGHQEAYNLLLQYYSKLEQAGKIAELKKTRELFAAGITGGGL
ncbi:tetratricopeptide repeat protein [Hufsiella ginkgonis]|uniref:Tetratricopeptide repeat protein n=1 Tax=Hufsiella ginkgonis TaxID=2695274 RepID=A0A7K1XVH2_9SPHI|nr:tetratricopeptide repeat protein [Hufsiella ginkgonis]MXV14991.1 tetratricopeptide repeat protein [Hufsiella ginkgonis]